MPYAITLRLDPSSAGRVRALWDALAHGELTDSAAALGYDPHLTLAILDDATQAATLIETVRRAAAGWDALPLHVPALAVFPAEPATLWLAPTVTAPLLRRHAALCAALRDARLHPHYRPGAWMPHLTLADDLTGDAIGPALAAAAEHFQPFAATLDRIDVVHFRPVTMLWHAQLAATDTQA